MAGLMVMLSRVNGGKLEFDQIVRYNEKPGMDAEQTEARDDINTVLKALRR